MATKDFNDLQNKAYGTNNHEQNCSNNQQEYPSIIDNRSKISSEAYLDGMWASNDYIEGFTKGFTDGVMRGRERILRQLSSEFRASRNAPLTIDLSSLCDNLPIIDHKPIFQLPKGV